MFSQAGCFMSQCGPHTSYSSQAVPRRVEGARGPGAGEQQRRDRAPAQCWGQKLHTNRPATRKVQDSRGDWKTGRQAERRGTLITGNISPGEAGGEGLAGEGQPDRRPGRLGEIRIQAWGGPPGPRPGPMESGGCRRQKQEHREGLAMG